MDEFVFIIMPDKEVIHNSYEECFDLERSESNN